MGKIDDTVKRLQELGKQHESVAVAYSDGKDSRVVMDLCVRSFRRVEAFYMYLVPGLECIDEKMHEAEKRWGIKVHQIPHEGLNDSLRRGIFCDPGNWDEVLPPLSLRDLYLMARNLLRCDVMATGAKAADSSWRRKYFHITKTWTDMHYPIKDWNKHDVLGYLRARDIPVPESSGLNASGISLIPAELLWLHDTHPKDFQRVCEFFPYAEAVVWRRKFHGK